MVNDRSENSSVSSGQVNDKWEQTIDMLILQGDAAMRTALRDRNESTLTDHPAMSSSPSMFRPTSVDSSCESHSTNGRNRLSGSGVAAQPIQLSPFTFGGSTGSPITNGHRGHGLLGRRRWAAVDQALRRNRRAHAFGDRTEDLHDALASVEPDPDLVARADELRRFGGDVVDADVSGPAGSGRHRPGL